MHSIRSRAAPQAPLPAAPDACARCAGTGRSADPLNETETCPACEGQGRVIVLPPLSRQGAPPQAYFAYSGGVLIDCFATLKAGVDALSDTWPDCPDPNTNNPNEVCTYGTVVVATPLTGPDNIMVYRVSGQYVYRLLKGLPTFGPFPTTSDPSATFQPSQNLLPLSSFVQMIDTSHF